MFLVSHTGTPEQRVVEKTRNGWERGDRKNDWRKRKLEVWCWDTGFE